MEEDVFFIPDRLPIYDYEVDVPNSHYKIALNWSKLHAKGAWKEGGKRPFVSNMRFHCGLTFLAMRRAGHDIPVRILVFEKITDAEELKEFLLQGRSKCSV